MRYVLDASVALKWVLDEPGVDRALFLRKEYDQGKVELIAPDILTLEVAHVLSKAYRQRIIDEDEAKDHLVDIMTSLPQLVPAKKLLPRAYAIALATRTSVYDAHYLALGELENVTVLTADKKLAKLPFAILEIEKLPYPNVDEF